MIHTEKSGISIQEDVEAIGYPVTKDINCGVHTLCTTYKSVETGNPVVGSIEILSMVAPPVIRVEMNGGCEEMS